MRVGHGFDAHRLVPERKLILGGVEVPFERGALGHSDADVLAHAIADALLGAAALGDLGAHFPDSDARWKDADSLDLLAACVAELQKANFRIVNIDATVLLERPKLAPFIEPMRAKIAACINIDIGTVSVKAKTSEGMGYIGDGSGIAAFAVALIADAQTHADV